MEKLRAKLKNQGGFTLVEMLIVVAIIAILVAVSIPIVNNALDRTKHATDAANERAAKGAFMIEYLAGKDATVEVKADGATVYTYDAVDGKIVEANLPTGDAHAKYGVCTAHKHEGMCIVMTMSSDGVITLGWNTSATMPTTSAPDLCIETPLT